MRFTFLAAVSVLAAVGAMRGRAQGVKPFPPRVDCVAADALSIHGWLTVDARADEFRLERNYEPLEMDGEPKINHQTGEFQVKLKKPVRAGNAIRLAVGSLAAVREAGACEADEAVVKPPAAGAKVAAVVKMGVSEDEDGRKTGRDAEVKAVKATEGGNAAAAPAKVETGEADKKGTAGETKLEAAAAKVEGGAAKKGTQAETKPDPAAAGGQGSREESRPKVAEPKEGDKMVTGSAEGFEHVMVTVLDHRDGFVEQRKTQVETEAGTFTAGLSLALSEGEKVDVRGIKAGDTAASRDATQVFVQPATYNWGRNRMYFSLGALTSNQDADFQKVRPYISLNFDTNWLHVGIPYPADFGYRFNRRDKEILNNSKVLEQIRKGEMPDVPEGLSEEGRKTFLEETDRWKRYGGREDLRWRRDLLPFREQRWHVLLNTYSEFRLMNSQSLALNELKAEKLKGGQRVSSFEFGMYAPVNHARTCWYYEGRKQSLFLAPLVKGGLESIPKPGEATSNDGYGMFKYVAGGARLGHYLILPHSQSVAPELLSWVDVTIGKWDRFRSESAPERSVMRFEATGRVKVPYTPITIGFSSNTGAGPDEFTFFAGTRFDMGKILSKVAPSLK